jgi:hypothetical protein
VSLAVGLMAVVLVGVAAVRAAPQIITDGVPKPKQYGTPMPLMGGAQLTSSEFSCCGLRLGAESQGRRFGAPVLTVKRSTAGPDKRLAERRAPPKLCGRLSGVGASLHLAPVDKLSPPTLRERATSAKCAPGRPSPSIRTPARV